MHGWKAHYDYCELTVEERDGRWRLALKDKRHAEQTEHEDEFATAADAKDAALPFAEHHINVEHNDTLLVHKLLTWQEY